VKLKKAELGPPLRYKTKPHIRDVRVPRTEDIAVAVRSIHPKHLLSNLDEWEGLVYEKLERNQSIAVANRLWAS